MKTNKGFLLDYIIPILSAILTLSALFLLSPLSFSDACQTPSNGSIIYINSDYGLCTGNYVNIEFSIQNNNIAFDLNGSTLYGTSAIYISNKENITIANGSFVKNGTTILPINSYASKNIIIENITFESDQEYGFGFIYADFSDIVTIKNCNFSNPSVSWNGIVLSRTNNTEINNVILDIGKSDNWGIPIRIDNATNTSITNAIIMRSSGHSIFGEFINNLTISNVSINKPQSDALFFRHAIDVNLSNVSISQHRHRAVYSENVSNIHISNSSITECEYNDGGIYFVLNASNITISHNNISSNREGRAIQFSDDAGSSYFNVTITHNTLLNNSQFAFQGKYITQFNFSNNLMVLNDGFRTVFEAENITNATIYNNTVPFVMIGDVFNIKNSKNVSLLSNQVNNSFLGILFNIKNVDNLTFRDNNIHNSTYAFPLFIVGNSSQYNINQSNNTIDNVPIIYAQNLSNTEVTGKLNASLAICANCNNVTVKDVSNVTTGLYVFGGNNVSIITNSTVPVMFIGANNSNIQNSNISSQNLLNLSISDLIGGEFNFEPMEGISIAISGGAKNAPILGSIVSIESTNTRIINNKITGAIVSVNSAGTNVSKNNLITNESVFAFANLSVNMSGVSQMLALNNNNSNIFTIDMLYENLSAALKHGAVIMVESVNSIIEENNIPSYVVAIESNNTRVKNNNMSSAIFVQSHNPTVQNNDMLRSGLTLNLTGAFNFTLSGGFLFMIESSAPTITNNNMSLPLIAVNSPDGTFTRNRILTDSFLNFDIKNVGIPELINLSNYSNLGIELPVPISVAGNLTNVSILGSAIFVGAPNAQIKENTLNGALFAISSPNTTIDKNNASSDMGLFINLSIGGNVSNISNNAIPIEGASIDLDASVNLGVLVVVDGNNTNVTNNNFSSLGVLFNSPLPNIINNSLATLILFNSPNASIQNNNLTKTGLHLNITPELGTNYSDLVTSYTDAGGEIHLGMNLNLLSGGILFIEGEYCSNETYLCSNNIAHNTLTGPLVVAISNYSDVNVTDNNVISNQSLNLSLILNSTNVSSPNVDVSFLFNLGWIMVFGSFDGGGTKANILNNNATGGIILVSSNESNILNNRVNSSIIQVASQTASFENMTGYANILNNEIGKQGFNFSIDVNFRSVRFFLDSIIGDLIRTLSRKERDENHFYTGEECTYLYNSEVIEITEVWGSLAGNWQQFRNGIDYELNNSHCQDAIHWLDANKPDHSTNIYVKYVTGNDPTNIPEINLGTTLNLSAHNILSFGIIGVGLNNLTVSDNNMTAPILLVSNNKTVVERNKINAGKDFNFNFGFANPLIMGMSLPLELGLNISMDFGGIAIIMADKAEVKNNNLSSGAIFAVINNLTAMDNHLGASMIFGGVNNGTIKRNNVTQGGAELKFIFNLGVNSSLLENLTGENITNVTNASANLSFNFQNPLTASVFGLLSNNVTFSDNIVDNTLVLISTPDLKIYNNTVVGNKLVDLRINGSNNQSEAFPVVADINFSIDSGSMLLNGANISAYNNNIKSTIILFLSKNASIYENNASSIFSILGHNSSISKNKIRPGLFNLSTFVSLNNTNFSEAISASTIFNFWSVNSTVSENNISGGLMGIYTMFSSNTTISSNNISNSRTGIYDVRGSTNIYKNNLVNGSSIGMYFSKGYYMDISNNTVIGANKTDKLFGFIDYIQNLSGNALDDEELVPSALGSITPHGILITRTNANIINNSIDKCDTALAVFHDKGESVQIPVAFVGIFVPVLFALSAIFDSNLLNENITVIIGGNGPTNIMDNYITNSKTAVKLYDIVNTTTVIGNRICNNTNTFNLTFADNVILRNNKFCANIFSPAYVSPGYGSLPWVNFTYSISNILQSTKQTSCELTILNCTPLTLYNYADTYTNSPICTNYAIDCINRSMEQSVPMTCLKTLEPANYTWKIYCGDNYSSSDPTWIVNNSLEKIDSLIVSEYDIGITGVSGPRNVTHNSSFNYRVSLKNFGIKTTYTTLHAIQDGVVIYDFPYVLLPNQSIDDSMNFIAPLTGTKTNLTFFFDPYSNITEYNEYNNVRTVLIDLTPIPRISGPVATPVPTPEPTPIPTPTPEPTPEPTPIPPVAAPTTVTLSTLPVQISGIPGLMFVRTITITPSLTTMRLYFANENNYSLENLIITETILKAFANNAYDISFSPQPTIVESDPVVRWDVEKISAKRGIYYTYSVSKPVSESVFNSFTLPVVEFKPIEVTPTPTPVQQVEIGVVTNQTTNTITRTFYSLTGITPPSAECGICDISAEKNCSCVALWLFGLPCGICWTVLLLLSGLAAFLSTKKTNNPIYIISAALLPFIIAFTTHCCMGITIGTLEVIVILALVLLRKKR